MTKNLYRNPMMQPKMTISLSTCVLLVLQRVRRKFKSPTFKKDEQIVNYRDIYMNRVFLLGFYKDESTEES